MQPLTHSTRNAIPLIPLTAADLQGWLRTQDSATRNWVKAQNFTAAENTALQLPDAKGNLRAVLAGHAPDAAIWAIAHLPALLPAGTYQLQASWAPERQAEAALGFLLAQYQFTAYRKQERKALTLALPKQIDVDRIDRRYRAIAFARDLINTPANDLTPPALADAARAMAKRTGAKISVISGDDLLKKNFPAIHAVGRASTAAPQFIDISWGNPKHPLVVLVGKGVTFDTGGLDIKPNSAMKLMKKDMGGAATVLGLTQLIIEEKLPIRLRTLIPAVENMIAGNAFRPQDVVQTRKGLTVEIGSPDAEGRVILADALYEGDQAQPALMLDIATLTGAARTALGTELPALFSNNDALAHTLTAYAMEEADPLWPLPLWQGYAKYVNSQVADITNSPNYGFAGSITAALFLERFVSPETPWVHLDSYAWNAENQPGRPVGGEPLGLRAIFRYLEERFGN